MYDDLYDLYSLIFTNIRLGGMSISRIQEFVINGLKSRKIDAFLLVNK